MEKWLSSRRVVHCFQKGPCRGGDLSRRAAECSKLGLTLCFAVSLSLLHFFLLSLRLAFLKHISLYDLSTVQDLQMSV